MLNRAITKSLGHGIDEGAGVQGEEEKKDNEAPPGGGAFRSGRDLLHSIRKIVVSISKSPLTKVRGFCTLAFSLSWCIFGVWAGCRYHNLAQ